MHIVDAHFVALDDTPITQFFRTVGVYVLWARNAKVRPSYLGEGHIIGRFTRTTSTNSVSAREATRAP